MGLLVSGLTQSSKFNKSQKKRNSFITYITPSIRELKTMMQDAKGMCSWNTARVKTQMLFPVLRPETNEISIEQAEGMLLLEATEVSSHLAFTVAVAGSTRQNSRMATLSPGQRPPGPTKPHSHMQWKQMLTANIIQKTPKERHKWRQKQKPTGEVPKMTQPETLSTNLTSQRSYLTDVSQYTGTLKNCMKLPAGYVYRSLWNIIHLVLRSQS